jgi:hypothetical protein
MALGSPGAGLAAGMPGAQAHWPGWQRHGCRRSPRTRRIARSRRSATRRPRRADPARRRRAARPRPARRTGACGSAVRGMCTRAGTAPASPPGPAVVPGWPRTRPARRRQAEEDLAREGVIAGMQGRKSGRELGEVSVAGQSVEHDVPGGGRVLGRGQLPGRHTLTVGQSRRRSAALLHGPLGRLSVAGRRRAGPLRQDRDGPRPVIDGVESTVFTAPGGPDVLEGRV